MIQEGSDFVHRVMAGFISGNVHCIEMKSYVIVHILIYRHELHLGVGRTANWNELQSVKQWAAFPLPV